MTEVKLVDNVLILVAAAVFAVVLFALAYRFLGEEKVKKWLRWAVLEAEKELQHGTGKAKIEKVYNLFVVTFPKLALIISRKRFEKLVDVALIWLDELLATNKKVASAVYNEPVISKCESEADSNGKN
jgi:hypothetical protein